MTAGLSFRTNQNGMPIVGKKDLDFLGEALVGDFAPEAMTTPAAIDVERFVQGYLHMELDFHYLTSNGVYLAMTVFNDTNKVPVYNPETRRAEYVSAKAGTVMIDKRLLEEGRTNRYRFSLGHEASHGILHTGYFNDGPRRTSLSDQSEVPIIRCRMAEPPDTNKPVTKWTDNDRMEWQANRLASAILMPRKMVYKLVTGNFSGKQPRGSLALAEKQDTVFLVADTFGVSKITAAYRLRELGLIDKRYDAEILTGTRNIMDIFVK